MRFLVLIALLSAPARAAVSLRWAPVLGQALPGQASTGGFDAQALAGLEVRLNEIHALAQAGTSDLDGLRRLLRTSGPALPSSDRLAALERSLTLLSPVIARLEAQGVRVDDRGNASKPLEPALARALGAETREDDARARELASRYADDADLDMALADSEAADSLLRERYLYLSPEAFDRLARVYDSGRIQALAARRAAGDVRLAMVAPDDRTTMRDAVAEPRPGLFQRLAARVRALAARLRG